MKLYAVVVLRLGDDAFRRIDQDTDGNRFNKFFTTYKQYAESRLAIAQCSWPEALLVEIEYEGE